MFAYTSVLHFACCIALSSARTLKQLQQQELEIPDELSPCHHVDEAIGLHNDIIPSVSDSDQDREVDVREFECAEETQFCYTGILQASPMSGGPEGDEHDCAHGQYRDDSEGASFESLLRNIFDADGDGSFDRSELHDLELSEITTLFDLNDDMFVTNEEFSEVMTDYSFDCMLLSEFACWFIEQTDAKLVFFSGR